VGHGAAREALDVDVARGIDEDLTTLVLELLAGLIIPSAVRQATVLGHVHR
jgi:hypothetical protein